MDTDLTHQESGVGTNEVTVEDQTYEETLQVALHKYDINSYGVDYPIDALVKRMKTKAIHIPPFQRNYRWKIKDASLFVESLLLGLPVPSIFLAKDGEGGLLVIDGQQRLKSLQFFYNNYFEPKDSKFRLTGLDSEFNGLTYDELTTEDQQSLDDSVMHAIIVKQEKPTEDNSSIFHIFQRLNSGGKRLNDQEIRTCLYHGDFVNLLIDLNNTSSWRKIFGNVNDALKDQELILRFLALYFWYENYNKPMKRFLNRFMSFNRKLKSFSYDDCTKVFGTTIDFMYNSIGSGSFKPKRVLVAGFYDAIMVGVARRLERGHISDVTSFNEAYECLIENEEFMGWCRMGTSDNPTVEKRLKHATNVFNTIE